MILFGVLVYVLLAVIWGWGDWRVSVTLLIVALIFDLILARLRTLRKRRRFNEAIRALESLGKESPPEGDSNVTPIK